jgi:hypothetical protein
MHEQRLNDIENQVIAKMSDKELLRSSWWMARAQWLLPLINDEIKRREI